MKKIFFLLTAVILTNSFAVSNKLLTKSVVKLIKDQKRLEKRIERLEGKTSRIVKVKTAKSKPITINSYTLDKKIKRYLEE